MTNHQIIQLRTAIKHKGKIELENLPLEEGEEVQIVISKIGKRLSKEEKTEKIKQTFGTIKNKPIVSLENLRRENLYNDDER